VPHPRPGSSLRRRLASALQRERARKRWTQEQAAEAAGLHPRHYQKLEEGGVNVTIGTLERLCRGFGVDVRRLFET
jgi:transcriptional regulator with XRE-family HTH domain